MNSVEVKTFLSKPVKRAVDNFQEDNGIRSTSAAIAEILRRYFEDPRAAQDHFINLVEPTLKRLSEPVETVGSEVKILRETVEKLVTNHIHLSTQVDTLLENVVIEDHEGEQTDGHGVVTDRAWG